MILTGQYKDDYNFSYYFPFRMQASITAQLVITVGS